VAVVVAVVTVVGWWPWTDERKEARTMKEGKKQGRKMKERRKEGTNEDK
jgi:hypothetical protein